MSSKLRLRQLGSALAWLLVVGTGACLPDLPPPPSPPPPSPTGLMAFNASFYEFAVGMCAGCHSEKPNDGVLVPQNPLFATKIVEYAYMAAKPFVDFHTPSMSLLVEYAGNNHCGIPAKCGSGSAAALAQVTAWIANDTPLPPVPPRAPVSDRHLLELVDADLRVQSATVQPYLRYFTLEAWGNTNGRPPLVSVEVERAALIKMLNLLSTARQIVHPTAVDAEALIYRVDMRDLGWSATAWASLKATDPYLRPYGPASTLAAASNQSVRADWFVSTIPNSADDAYYKFLGIDSNDPTIDARNHVDRFADMMTGAPATVRGGITVSRTEGFNRIISWHNTTAFGRGPSGSGHLFKSYNMASDVGTGNIFAHPFRPTTNLPIGLPASEYDFEFGDSDNMFTLPNGLFGFYTTVPAGGAVANVATAGEGFPGPTKCFRCHDNETNLIPFVDQVHAAVAAAPAGAFPGAMRTLLLGMYDQSAMDAKIAAAGSTFRTAYAQLALPAMDIAGTPTGLATEVMNVVTNNYAIVLQVDTAAAELGVTPPQLVTAIKSSPVLATRLASLVTADASLKLTGVVRRDAWEADYAVVRSLVLP